MASQTANINNVVAFDGAVRGTLRGEIACVDDGFWTSWVGPTSQRGGLFGSGTLN